MTTTKMKTWESYAISFEMNIYSISTASARGRVADLTAV